LKAEDQNVDAKILHAQQNIRLSQLLDAKLYPPLSN
jgi:hypothetical protein